MTNVEMRELRDLIALVRSSDWEPAVRDRIVARLILAQLQGPNWVHAFNKSLPLEERVTGFDSIAMDRTLASRLATSLGLSLVEKIGRFDPIWFDGELSYLSANPQFREKIVRRLRSVGYRSLATDTIPSTDGLNHYNIYSQSRNPVGQLASNFASSPDGSYFDTPHGPYRTLEGYYHVLRVLDYFLHLDTEEEISDYPLHQFDNDPVQRDLFILECFSMKFPEIDRMREVDGAEGIRAGRLLKKAVYGGSRYRPGAFSEHVERCFMKAVVHKLHKLKLDGVCLGNIMAEIHQQGIPFEHYYVMNGKIHIPNHADWLPGLYTRIVENIDPYAVDFDPEDVIKQLG